MRFILDHRYVGKFNFKVTQKQVLSSVNNLSRNGKRKRTSSSFPYALMMSGVIYRIVIVIRH